MSAAQQSDTAMVRRYHYDDRTVFVADFGAAAAPSVDVVGGTAIIVGDDGTQREIDLPLGEVQAVNRNGIVSIEVRE